MEHVEQSVGVTKSNPCVCVCVCVYVCVCVCVRTCRLPRGEGSEIPHIVPRAACMRDVTVVLQ
jgi:hypothetical protein